MATKQFFILLIIATVLGLGVNLFLPDKLPIIGHYRELSAGDGPVVPPAAAEGDPPFIAIDVAEMEYSAGDVLFVDAREVSEFECGTIPGSVSLPFEYLPEDNLEAHIDSVFGGVAKDHTIIVYCSGEECDLSLHLARNLQALDYTNVLIFFGGSREWENNDLEIERRVECGE